MKKIISLFIIVLTIFSLASCKSNKLAASEFGSVSFENNDISLNQYYEDLDFLEYSNADSIRVKKALRIKTIEANVYHGPEIEYSKDGENRYYVSKITVTEGRGTFLENLTCGIDAKEVVKKLGRGYELSKLPSENYKRNLYKWSFENMVISIETADDTVVSFAVSAVL